MTYYVQSNKKPAARAVQPHLQDTMLSLHAQSVTLQHVRRSHSIAEGLAATFGRRLCKCCNAILRRCCVLCRSCVSSSKSGLSMRCRAQCQLRTALPHHHSLQLRRMPALYFFLSVLQLPPFLFASCPILSASPGSSSPSLARFQVSHLSFPIHLPLSSPFSPPSISSPLLI